MVAFLRQFIGLRLIWWGLSALPNETLRIGLAEAIAKACADEIKRAEFVAIVSAGIAESQIKTKRKGE